MIIEKTTEELQTNGDIRVVPIRIDQSAAATFLLIDFLASLYSDTTQTVMFEYVSNAIDSHTVAGKSDVPIEIHLPHKLNPFFIVKDEGVGMTEEQIENIYAVVLNSTKRDSNATIGGYGVGKLVFSPYCGVMFVTSWKDGIKTVAQCRLKDGDGDIAFIQTNEPTTKQGFEVKIPVKESDFDFFHRNAKYCYSFLKTKPIIKGGTVELGYDTVYSDDKFSILKDKIPDRTTIIATIGGIPFPVKVSTYDLDIKWDSEEYRFINKYIPTVLHFNVGEIDHTKSRDQLEYSEKTKSAIRGRISYVCKTLKNFINDKINGIDDLHEIRMLLKDLKSRSEKNVFSKITDLYVDNTNDIKFEGKNVAISFSSTSDIHINDYSFKGRGRDTIKRTSEGYTYGDPIITIPDYFKQTKINPTIKSYLNDINENRITVLRGSSEAIEAFFKNNQIPTKYSKCITELPEPIVIQSRANNRSYNRTVKKGKVFSYKFSIGFNKGVHAWDECELDFDNGCGVYIPIKYFKPIDDINISNIESAIDYAKELNPDLVVYGIKKSEVNKIKSPNLISVEEYFNKLVSNLFDEIKIPRYIITNTRISEPYAKCEITDIARHTKSDNILYYNKLVKKSKHEVRDNSREISRKIDIYKFICQILKIDNKLKPIKDNKRLKIEERLSKAKRYIVQKYPLLDRVTYPQAELLAEYIDGVNLLKRNKKRLTNI